MAEIFGVDISDMTIKMRTKSSIQDTKNWIAKMRGIMDSNAEVAPKTFDISMLGTLSSIKSYRQFNKETLEHFGVKFCVNNQRIVIPIHGMTLQVMRKATLKR